ncbi:MAG: biotin/lipoyl-binding protein [Myxococcota bacterium]|nr:biotin/lipoyl-binding protein [Deltaproteobacteria bacterium]MDQ3338035.1 biotin/lipoyl-binding protein [Myxococcota bacterium]
MKRDLIVTADGRDRTVTVEGPTPEGMFHVTIDGTLRIVDGRAIRPGTWSLLIDGTSFVVDLDQRRNGIHASVGAGEATLQVEDALHRRLSQAAGGRGNAQRGETIRAPIAGKVVKVLVETGDQVAAGAPVIVLEAMKMENELVAERGGTVGAIHKSAGQAVDTGDLLVELT